VSASTLRAAVAAEWTKVRTLRSTAWTLLLTFALSVGLAYLFGLSFRNSFDNLPSEQRRTFDPLFATFYGLTLSQLALVVFGVLLVSAEYGTGTINASLVAMPRRGLFYAAKALGGLLPVLGVSLVTVAATFFAAQAALGPHGTSLGADGVPLAVAGACVYLVAICAISIGVATMLRSSMRSLAILLPLLFLGSQGLGNIPKVKTVAQYLPDQAGMVLMHITGPAGDPRFGHDYGAWGAFAILAAWTAAALLGGCLVLRRRDA
jgi:ABC-2 type transport system permease protein